MKIENTKFNFTLWAFYLSMGFKKGFKKIVHKELQVAGPYEQCAATKKKRQI